LCGGTGRTLELPASSKLSLRHRLLGALPHSSPYFRSYRPEPNHVSHRQNPAMLLPIDLGWVWVGNVQMLNKPCLLGTSPVTASSKNVSAIPVSGLSLPWCAKRTQPCDWSKQKRRCYSPVRFCLWRYVLPVRSAIYSPEQFLVGCRPSHLLRQQFHRFDLARRRCVR
jgi:hypothetical protein